MPYKILPKKVVDKNLPIDLTGIKISALTVIRFVGMTKSHQRIFECKCDCGEYRNITGLSLRNGSSKSCGCHIQNNEKYLPHNHGRAKVPIVCGIYKITNPNGQVYIGSSRTIYRRWLRHREARKKIKVHLSIKEFGWQAHKFEIITELPKDVSDEVLIGYEQIYIDFYKDEGVCLLNVKDAGSKSKFPQESRIKMSIAQKIRHSK